MNRQEFLPRPTAITGVLLLLLTGAADLSGQTNLGGLRGAVRDANGGVIRNAEVTLTNQLTNIMRSTVSNEAGEYAFQAVLPGTYTLRVVVPGFKRFERQGLNIGTQQFLTIDVEMEVGDIGETVTVTAESPVIQTSNASLGDVLDQKALETLPTMFRNAWVMPLILPKVFYSGDQRFTRQQDSTNVANVSIGGGQRRGNNYLLDGVAITDFRNRPSLVPSIEAIDELRVQVHTYDAEVGRTTGGVFIASHRSGTNEFHGTVLYQMRPEWGRANDFFAERRGIPKPTGLSYNLYGGGVGGPIVRNRTFFYVSMERYRIFEPRTGSLIFPTDRELNGDFSQSFDRNGRLVIIYDPLTTRSDGMGGFIRTPFAGNVIPPNRINRVARNIANLFPKPDVQRSGADGVPNYTRTSGIEDRATQITTKINHKFSDKWSLSGMYAWNPSTQGSAKLWESPNGVGPDFPTNPRRRHVLALNAFHYPNAKTVATLRFGWMRFSDIDQPGKLGRIDPAGLGFADSFLNNLTRVARETGAGWGFPGMGIGDIPGIGGGSFEGPIYKSWAVNGTVSKLIGRHTLKFGGEFRDMRMENHILGSAYGSFRFDRGWTQANPFASGGANDGNPFASFLLGLPSADPSSPSFVPVSPVLEFFERYYAGYLQDDFRVTSNLTLNLGLRYDYETGLREIENRFTVAFDRDAISPLAAKTGLNLRGGLRFAGQDGWQTHQTDPSKARFGPRIGLAWVLGKKTVLRGGYGLFWAPWLYARPGTDTYGQIGYSRTTFVDQSNRLTPTVTIDNPFPNGLLQPVGNRAGLLTGVGGPITFVPHDRKSSYVQQFSFDLQHQLPGNMALQVGYAGSRGDRTGYGGQERLGVVNINQLRPEHLALGSALQQQVPNPFFNIPEAGPLSTRPTVTRAQLLRPFPQFLDILAEEGGGRSRYHSLSVGLDKRPSPGGWGGKFHYTWSRLDDNQFGERNYFAVNNATRPLNNYDLEAEYARSMLDVPHRLVLVPIIDLPFGEGRRWARNGLWEKLFGGFTVSVIASYESGFPLTIVQATDNTGSFSGVQRPNWTGVSPKTAGSTIDRLNNWINTAAYEAAPAFTFGTGKRTDPRIRSPFRTSYDLVVAKDTSIVGRLKAQIRLESINVTNNPKFFDGGATRLGLASNGRLTAILGSMRTTQISFRLSW